MKKYAKVLGKVILVLLGILAIGGVAFVIACQVGKINMGKNLVAKTNGEDSYKEVLYGEKEYVYRDNRINIMCIGVDKREGMAYRDADTGSIGQGDVLILLTIDLDTREIHMISIPRDTMVTLEKYNGNGDYCGQTEGQITLQYAYGDGQDLSASLTAMQVSKLLGNIPIHGYVAINVKSLRLINDEVGGVDITMDEDYTLYNPLFEKGATVHLYGDILENYLRERDKQESGSAYSRIHRTKQYVMAFYEKAIGLVKEDIMLPFRILEKLRDHMVTSISTDEMLHILTEVIDCSFSEKNMYTLPGEIIRNENYEEFYLDQQGVNKILIDLFYEKA